MHPTGSSQAIPGPSPTFSRLLELRKVNLPWLLVQNQTQHVTFLLPWHANIKNLLILRPPPKHNYVKRTFGSFFHWCTGTVLCLLAHFIGEIGPDDGPPVPSRFNCLVCCTQVMSTHLMTGYMDCEVIRDINATYSLIYWLIHWFVD